MEDLSKEEQNTTEELNNIDDESTDWLDIVGSGALKKKIITNGKDGVRPKKGDEVTINVVGSLEDGTQVEEFHELSFTLGGGEVIPGFNLVVALMNLSEEAEVFMESRLAYGELGLEEKISPNSNMCYNIKLVDFKSEESPEELDIQTRKNIGERKRDRGNFWFNRKEYSQSVQCYKNALDFLDDTSNSENEEMNDQVKDILEMRLKTLNNMAAAQLKLEAYEAALISLGPVLKCQPYNVKALYRKGKVLWKQNKLNESLQTFIIALELEPQSNLLQHEVAELKRIIKKENDNEKSLYKKMLGLSYTSSETKERYPTLRGKHIKTIAICFILILASGIAFRSYM